MATIPLTAHDFPEGTVVSAYPREALPPGGSVPVGSVAATATVSSGVLTFTGLTEGRRYLAWANGRQVSFFVPPGSTDTLRPITGQEAQALRLTKAGLADSNTFTAPQTVSPTGDTTSLTVTRSSTANTNAIVMKNDVAGGRVGATWRVTRSGVDYDLLRIQAHDALDPGSSVSQGVAYTQRATPRLDGALVEARQLWYSEVDISQHGFFAGGMTIDTHDTDNNLNTTAQGMLMRRSPTDFANESSEQLRSRASSLGTNYWHRNLAAVDTAGPLARFFNENAGDDQDCIRVTHNAGAGTYAIRVTAGDILAQRLEIDGALDHDGSTVGFYGVTPVARAATIASPTADVTALKTAVDAIRTALYSIGITSP